MLGVWNKDVPESRTSSSVCRESVFPSQSSGPWRLASSLHPEQSPGTGSGQPGSPWYHSVLIADGRGRRQTASLWSTQACFHRFGLKTPQRFSLSRSVGFWWSDLSSLWNMATLSFASNSDPNHTQACLEMLRSSSLVLFWKWISCHLKSKNHVFHWSSKHICN